MSFYNWSELNIWLAAGKLSRFPHKFYNEVIKTVAITLAACLKDLKKRVSLGY